jgi:hypothetical protein
MVVKRIGAKVPASRLWLWPGVPCVLAAFVALAASAGLRHVHAQVAAQAPAADVQAGATEAPAPSANGENPPAATAASATKPSSSISPQEQRKQEVANECANLLKMATDLKAEVNKTTKDELSINVVRKADEIEQLARKVRGDTRLTAGKN